MALTLTSEVTHLVLCENGAGTALHNAAHNKAEVAVVTEDFLVHLVETGEELQSAFVAAEDSGMGMIGSGRFGGDVCREGSSHWQGFVGSRFLPCGPRGGGARQMLVEVVCNGYLFRFFFLSFYQESLRFWGGIFVATRPRLATAVNGQPNPWDCSGSGSTYECSSGGVLPTVCDAQTSLISWCSASGRI